MKIRFLSPANEEVDDAVAWYKEKRDDLENAFLDELDRIVRLVRTHPLLAKEIEPEIRRFLFVRFPYSLIYGVDEDSIVVIAVAHQQRRPRYWADRVEMT
jgi:plasmid stabilization system protein ParE